MSYAGSNLSVKEDVYGHFHRYYSYCFLVHCTGLINLGGIELGQHNHPRIPELPRKVGKKWQALPLVFTNSGIGI